MSETAMQVYDRDSQIIELERQMKKLEAEIVRLRAAVKSQSEAIPLILAATLRQMAAGIDSNSSTNAARPAQQDVPSGGSLAIRPDEFFGMTQAEASRTYLRKVGHAITLDELAEALRTGGCKLSGSNPKKVLYVALIRNTHDFRAPQRGYIGLAEFYQRG